MKNTLTKVCLLSGLVIFGLSGCYYGDGIIVCQRPPKPRPYYMVHKAPPPSHHHIMPRAPHHSSPAPSFRHNPGGPSGHSGGPGGHSQSAPKPARR